MPVTLSPLRYPGGKTQLCKFVKNVMCENNISYGNYVEPFAGGAGIAIELLLKGIVRNIYINDYDYAIYSIWHSIINETESFVQMIRDINITIEEWRIQKSIYANQSEYSSLQVGFAAFFLNRTNNSGVILGGPIGRMDQSGKYKIDCRFNKDKLIEKIYAIAEKKENICVSNQDAKDFIRGVIVEKLKSDETFIFFDPPYYKQGKNLYTNFFNHENHVALSEQILRLSDYHWITTYDFNKEIAKMYSEVPTKTYQLMYSANRKRKEFEYLFHSHKTIVSSFDKVQFTENEEVEEDEEVTPDMETA
ncbi:DNA adenine methylase [Bacillus thuringiensis]|uniref:DNA adenine methylase n=1 Tax=Bacillus thuringiensis TaxID=1428 RepID=UPI0005CE3E95|nr:DNA adenine methylase [Bacillus thuringiensis]